VGSTAEFKAVVSPPLPGIRRGLVAQAEEAINSPVRLLVLVVWPTEAAKVADKEELL
jgi:hypothetical protein